MIRWDISSIPPGSTVESAEITFNITDPTTSVYELYQLTRSWDEGVVSWTAATGVDNWDTAGAQAATDRNSTVLGELSIATTGIYTFSLNTDGVAAVQSWVDAPATNQGIIIANSTSGNGVDFNSRELGAASNRPKLTVTYTPPPDTVRVCSGELSLPRARELMMDMLAATTVTSSSTKVYLTPLAAWNEK